MLMDKKIEILEVRRLAYIIAVDGQPIYISNRNNTINFTSVEDIKKVLQTIDDVFDGKRGFQDVCHLISGKNLIAILDAVYAEKTVERFTEQYEETITKSYITFDNFFLSFFSFPCTRQYGNYAIVAKLKGTANTMISKLDFKDRVQEVASNNEFTVKYISTIGNVAAFFINKDNFDICLRGRPFMRSCKEVLDSITSLQAALEERNRTGIMAIIEKIGIIATIRIMQICYPKLAIDYFISLAEERVENRQYVYPALLLKEFFNPDPYRGEARKFYFTILQALEKRMPDWNRQLIDDNKTEVLSEKSTWTIFFYSDAKTLFRHNFNFIGAEQLQRELRKFLRGLSTIGRSTPDTHTIESRFNDIIIFIDVFYNKLDVYLDSICNLTKTDMQLVLSYFFQETDYEYTTIKRSLLSFRLFYNYITGMQNDNPQSPFYKVQLPASLPNPTTPLSKEARDAIMRALNKLPGEVQLGIKIISCTGIRSGSLAELTTNSLIHRGDECVLRVFLRKTYKYRIKNGLPTYIDYSIPQELGKEIEQFIQNTQKLREEFDRPYLLVYQPVYRRNDTNLHPFVLNGRSLGDAMTKILNDAQIKTSEGILESASLRSVRAEVGRMLFAQGNDAEKVAAYLGNSPMVAQSHYDTYKPIDDAKMYDTLYQQTIETNIAQHPNNRKPHTVMYGTCTSTKECKGKDCRNCPALIQCEEGEK